jgi:hypothetical protein
MCQTLIYLTEPGKNEGTPMDRLFIPEGCTLPSSDFSADERLAYWSRADVWRQLLGFLKD